MNSKTEIDILVEKVKIAQQKFADFPQQKLDEIFKAAAKAACAQRIPLAQLAVEETQMGVFEDKVIKNHYASEFIYNAYKNEKTSGVIENDESAGFVRIAEPIGIIAALIPTTNPTSTTIFKSLIALKTGNGIILSPHPRAVKSTIAAAKIVHDCAVRHGAPENIISWIETPSKEKTNELMQKCNLILATGGDAMVKAAYSSGTPAIGVGAGNVPAIIDDSADVKMAVNSIIHSKCFDNGVICASEQAVIVSDKMYMQVRQEFQKRGCYFLKPNEIEKMRKVMIKNGTVNPEIVGQSSAKIAKTAGIQIPDNTKIIIGEIDKYDENDPFSYEKLSVVLAMYKSNSFDNSVELAQKLINSGGLGHTSAVYLDENTCKDKLDKFSSAMQTCRIVVNSPSSQGGIGDMYNFRLPPSLTLGCGSWGKNSVCENIGVKHLLNIKTVSLRRENMLWFRVPQRFYFKAGCMRYALREIAQDMGKKRAFVVTDEFLYTAGYTRALIDELESLNFEYTVFFDVKADPTLDMVKRGADDMARFNPDVIIAFGGGSAMDAAKLMWVLYEEPEADFADMSMRFADIRKRISNFPNLGQKAYFVAIPTTSGTGAEVTPFSVITDEKTGIKYPLADYSLVPDMAIIDVNLHKSAPPSLTAASGFDALTHALEAYVSVLANDFTDSMALYAIKLIFENLNECCVNGQNNLIAREKMANAASMAGMSFGNAFLGLCHAMAHKLGAAFGLPHGIANALMIVPVMRYSASERPTRMGSFSQYHYPNALQRYAQIARYIGINGADDNELLEKLIEKINALKAEIGIKRSISEYGVDRGEFEEKLDELCLNAFDDQCVGANPRYPLVSEIRELYLEAF